MAVGSEEDWLRLALEQHKTLQRSALAVDISRTQERLVEAERYPQVALVAEDHLDGPITIDGPGGPLTLTPFRVQHGEITALGFRIGGLVYLPDVSDIPDAAWPLIEDAPVFVIDALRHEPHPSHAHLALSLDWIARARSPRAVLTNMHIDMDYAAVAAQTPDHVEPAFDGMQITVPAAT